MREEFIRLNIAIKLEQPLADKAINLSKQLSEKGKTIFVLDGKRFIPHMTIYSPEFPAKNLGQIYQKLSQITESGNSFELDFKGVSLEFNTAVVDYGISDSMRRLHGEILEALNPLREGHLRPKYQKEEYLKTKTDLEKENVEEFGYHSVGKLYSPHISIIRFEESEVAEEAVDDLVFL